ncbi:tyrosine-type recombinase/integrase [Mycolicibacterium sp.]|uniref:tyrosine-type recombinase/integrase n=1 Tax=Mycolicibacterium sp. TaxID=2320850 RepID=UPI00355DF083
MQQRRRFGRIRQCQPSGRWQAAYTGPDGKVYRAPKTFALREDAEGWLSDRRREIDRDLWSAPATEAEKRRAKLQKKAATKFSEYSTQWVTTRTVKGRPLKPRTKQHYTQLLDDHLIPAFGAKAIRDITPDMVRRWYAKTLTDKPTLRAHTYSLLRTVLETARTEELIASNPCMIRGAGGATRKIKPRPATLEELAVIEAEMPESHQLMIPLAGLLALRFGEIIELRRKDIDTKHGVVMIRRGVVRTDDGWIVGEPKSEAGVRDVAIPPHMLPQITAHLKRYAPNAEDLLFPARNGGYLQPSTLYRWFYKARAEADRADLRFHDLRHSGAVLAAQTGATIKELMVRLGHSSQQASLAYQHAAQGRDAQIAAALSEMVELRGRKKMP